MTAWLYEEEDDVYYQLGLPYCASPADASYETMGLYVPGGYFDASDNGDGTFTCTVDPSGQAGGYTASDAPIILPVNTPGYAAMSAPTEYGSSFGYGSVADYTGAGMIVAFGGARGRDHGAPAGVTDLKAIVRYVRYNADLLPGDTDRIFTEGMSGGGAQSALMGATGDSDLYTPYLEAIGAVMGVSDAVMGSMCWCPITSLDAADAAYEWMMGPTRSGLTEEEQAISDALAAAFPTFLNGAGLVSPEGDPLTLEESEDGIWQAGSYYDYLKGVIEGSLDDFLSDTTFPYDASASSGRGGPGGGMGGGPGGGGGRPEGMDGAFGGPNGAGGGPGDGADSADGTSYEELDDIVRNETSGGVTLSGTYETAQDYIDALNADGEWVSYDAESGTVTISSVEDFVLACKRASKSLGAFDQLDAGQGENTLFGYGDGAGAHFDSVLAGILEEQGNDYAEAFAEDLSRTDAVGSTAGQRLRMYTPLYFLLESEAGYGTSSPAPYWRIRTGIAQSDTSLTTEVDLALALGQYEGVEDVDFATVWGMQHTTAERTGDSTANFIAWVNDRLSGT